MKLYDIIYNLFLACFMLNFLKKNRKQKGGEPMFVLIYDEHDLTKNQKPVISVHRSRETAEKALENRMKKLKKRVWECDTRIVWVDGKVRPGDYLTSTQFSTWRPGEKIPAGETHSDTD